MPARTSYRLPDSLTAAAAPALAEALRARRGKPLKIEAGAVRRIGGQSLQVLLAAAAAWRADARALVVVDPSPEFTEALRLLGLDLASLAAGDTAP